MPSEAVAGLSSSNPASRSAQPESLASPGDRSAGAESLAPADDRPDIRPDRPSALDRPSSGRLARVEQIMGTAISIDVRDPDVPAAALDAVFEYLRDVDRRFSTYKPDSEISRIGRGELALEDASADVRWIMGLCDDLARVTDGYFDARRYRADGLPDPTGVVKGWAVEEAGFVLLDAGVRNFLVNGGGDIVARGSPEPGSGRPWRVGIRHPGVADRLACVVEVRDGAVATSGTYERGGHVVDPHTGHAATDLVSLTVVGPSLTYADAYATAGFAMGRRGVAWVAGREGYEAFGITADGAALATPGLPRAAGK